MLKTRLTACAVLVYLNACSVPAVAQTASQPAAAREELRSRAEPAIARALAYLAKEQAADGGWHRLLTPFAPGVSSLVLKGFIQDPHYGRDHEIVRRGIAYVLKHQQKDGGIYSQGGYGNYMTSVALMMLAATKDPDLRDEIEAAQRFLKSEQYTDESRDDQGREIDTGHPWYGGTGRLDQRKPDLSNTQLMLEALHESGIPADDPVYQRAIRFIERCQMSSQTNDQPFARGAEDGGFIYSPAGGGESKAGTAEIDGRKQLRSYGSMTYAAFKSLLYANLDRDDPRVQQAWGWIRRHYTLESNPNMPGRQSKEGLFYFYHAFARALHAWGQEVLIDGEGTPHDWRAELCDRLIGLQRRDGSWVNESDRFQEGDPHLVTAYAVLALQTVLEEPAAR